MYCVLFNSTNKVMHAHLKDGLPKNIELVHIPGRENIRDKMKHYTPDAFILGLSDTLPNQEDLRYLQLLVSLPYTPAIIVIAHTLTASQAVCLIKNGAYDCFSGYVSGDLLGNIITRLISNSEVHEEEKSGILGNSKEIVTLRAKLLKYARLDYTILISGETGCGKELAAKLIHSESSRKNGPFTPINCAAYSDELLSTELFGSQRGAFTGSIDRPGLFEISQGGTLFLDEIGELSLLGQAKLLRVIEEKKLRRMGGNKLINIDVRIIAATNRSLAELIAAGEFRTDLYYRINHLSVTIPPLRQRKEDIPRLAHSCLSRIPGTVRDIDSTAMKTLIEYPWPGNVRELQSVILKSALNAQNGTIRISDISFD
ncbi:MAG: hypothetical protein B0D92_06655 [Spirochaeta sp. LUC14_002_19_P3]|nr:MAG: hypothetical protein B0D92_06655 [Spirochaeta sp. LUC14_002_19_P3]